MYLYNGGTAVHRYIKNWIPMFHHKSVSSDTVSVHRKCRTAPLRLWFCWREQEESRTRLWIFRADYIEHHFEARAMLPPISDALCNRLFLFFLHQTTEWPSEWGYDFATIWAKQRRGETPGQERHSGRTAKAFLTLSLLRAHFYTGVFHTSYVRSARQTDNNSEVVSVLPSLRSEQGTAPLALLCSYPSALVSTKRFFKSFRTHKAENTNTQRRFYGIHT